MSEATKKTAWQSIADNCWALDAALAPIDVAVGEDHNAATGGLAPVEVVDALRRAEQAVGEARKTLCVLARKIEAGELRRPCAHFGCGDDQENRTGLCYNHRQAAATEGEPE